MLGTTASSRISREGMPGRTETVFRRRNLLNIHLDHDVFNDLPTFGGTILQTVEPVFHFGDAALQTRCQSLVGQRSAYNSGDNLMQVCQSLDCIGKGLIVEVRLGGADPVTDRTISGGSKIKVHRTLP